MKQYVIDELRPEDHEKLKIYLDQNFNDTEIGGVYWIPLDRDQLSRIQADHHECAPFYFIAALESASISCEFLIRTKNTIRCSCIGYSTEKQRNWIIGLMDAIFEQLKIIC